MTAAVMAGLRAAGAVLLVLAAFALLAVVLHTAAGCRRVHRAAPAAGDWFDKYRLPSAPETVPADPEPAPVKTPAATAVQEKMEAV